MKYLKQLLFFYFTTYINMIPQEQHDKETERIHTIEDEYAQRIQLLENDLHDDLHPLYLGLSREQAVPAEVLDHFTERMVRFTYDYIHLMEYIIWKIIDPTHKLDLAVLLTPILKDIPRTPTEQERDLIIRSFLVKSVATNINLKQGGQERMVRNWFPSAQSLPQGQWIYPPLLLDYFWFMNVDE